MLMMHNQKGSKVSALGVEAASSVHAKFEKHMTSNLQSAGDAPYSLEDGISNMPHDPRLLG